jgi:hypothetical protein
MSELRADPARRRGAILPRDVPGEGRSNEAGAGPRRCPPTSAPGWAPAIDGRFYVDLGHRYARLGRHAAGARGRRSGDVLGQPLAEA